MNQSTSMTQMTGTGVDDNDYQVPFRFTGKIAKLTIKLGPEQLMAEDQKAKAEAVARLNNQPSE